MKRIFGSCNFPREAAGAAVALGNFDGVHLGHAHVIRRAAQLARQTKAACAVYTFDPHPVRILAPAECPPLIQTLDQKLASFEGLGVDICVVEKFTEELAARGAEEFFREVVAGRLGASAIVVGYDFTFGSRRCGTAELLAELGKKCGIAVEVLDAQFLGKKLISSTNVRRLIEHGETAEAGCLLGRPYSIRGTVVPGRGIGRELAARTANIETANECIPANGVYLTESIVEGKSYPSITSIGDNPTFPHAPFAIEAHFIDATVDVMGKSLDLVFFHKMRDQAAFASVEELKGQIARDIELARMLHGERGLKNKDSRKPGS